MTLLAFAWRSLVRQPARAALGTLGVAAVGALLLDMLLLSGGLVASMRDLLDRSGFDVRVTATDEMPGRGPRLEQATAAVSALLAIPSVRGAVAVRAVDARADRLGDDALSVGLLGVGGRPSLPWTVLRGRDLGSGSEAVINGTLARDLGLEPGSAFVLRASCGSPSHVLPPVTLLVAISGGPAVVGAVARADAPPASARADLAHRGAGDRRSDAASGRCTCASRRHSRRSWHDCEQPPKPSTSPSANASCARWSKRCSSTVIRSSFATVFLCRLDRRTGALLRAWKRPVRATTAEVTFAYGGSFAPIGVRS